MDVEKGIAEARLVKKKHMEELKQLESPDPVWLLELKRQDDEAALEEAARKKVFGRAWRETFIFLDVLLTAIYA